MNTFGIKYRLTDFGESNSKMLGGIIDGCPAGLFLDMNFIESELIRRKPSSNIYSTKRNESDIVRFVSGVKDGYTIGSPIGFIIDNEDIVVDNNSVNVLKPSNSSLTYMKKYGAKNNTYCGRASARQTVCRVVGGAIAKLYLKKSNIIIFSEGIDICDNVNANDSIGAKIKCVIENLPAGLGEPVYDKFQARLAYAMLSINGCKGFEIGEGFNSANIRGSDYNDLINRDMTLKTNHDGGVQAGITNGMPVIIHLAFKPISTINMETKTIDFQGRDISYLPESRNDKCVFPRILPVVEAMAAMVTIDFMLLI